VFRDLCSPQPPPPPPVFPYYPTDLLLQDFSHTISALSFLFIFVSHSKAPCRPPPPPHHTPLTPPSTLGHCSSCDSAVRASGTTASSHLKHFRETHICCSRTQRDMPRRRPFEVASHGEPEPGILCVLRNHKETLAQCNFWWIHVI